MTKIQDLMQKRATLWEKAKNFLETHRDENGIVSDKDNETYEKMEADIVKMGNEIKRLERQEQLDREMNAPTSSPIVSTPSSGMVDDKTGRASNEYKNAFWNALRGRGVSNALQIGTDTEGGYLVPDEFESTLISSLEEANFIRQYAHIIQTSTGDRKIPVSSSKGTASWIEEEGAIPESDDAFSQVTLGAHKLSTMIKVSNELINDSVFDIETYLANEFARRIASAEEDAFINGNGTNKPTGIFNTAEVGLTTASATAITADEMIDLYHSLKEPYRKNAIFVTNDATIKAIRKLKDTTGQYMWQPSLTAGAPDTILGRPVKASYFAPTIASGAKTMAFGDLSYYWIADRTSRVFKRLDQLFATTDQVGYLATQRVDGKLILPESVKTLKMKATS